MYTSKQTMNKRKRESEEHTSCTTFKANEKKNMLGEKPKALKVIFLRAAREKKTLL